jgi:hypothetical protein
MTPAERALRTFLLVMAAVLLAALGAVVMPAAWMTATSESLGLGDLPDRPLLSYLARSVSVLYALHGAMTWFLSSDVRRYGPAIRFQAVVTMICGMGLLVLDVAVGMPAYWVLAEGPSVVAVGAVLLWLQRRCEGGPASST